MRSSVSLTRTPGVLAAVKKYRKEVETRRANLQHARADQADVVAQRAAERSSIQSRIGEREQMLASVRDEIAKLQAEERARQVQLAAAAEARARAQELALQQQATESYTASVDANTFTADIPAARYSQVVSIALQYLGIPYVWGGASPSTGFDCSGFVQYVYAQAGVYLPHHAASQFAYGVPVSRDQLEPGDLVFFDGLGHVGIYIGGGEFVHAPHTGDVVKISSLYEDWTTTPLSALGGSSPRSAPPSLLSACPASWPCELALLAGSVRPNRACRSRPESARRPHGVEA